MQALLRRLGVERDEVAVLGCAGAARPREAGVASACVRRPRANAGSSGCPMQRSRARSRSVTVVDAGQCRGGGAGDRGRAARSDRNAGRNGRAGHARPRARPPRGGGARALERGGRRTRAAMALADTPAGVFARLAAEAALGGLAPVTLLALLKHPLLRLGAREAGHTPRDRCAGTRDPARPAAASRNRGPCRCAGDVPARTRRPAPQRSAPETHRRATSMAADGLVGRLAAALAPLEELGPGPRAVQRHCGASSRGRRRPQPRRPWRRWPLPGDDGTALATALDELAAAPDADLRGRAVRLRGAVPRAHRRPHRAPSRRAGRARAHLRPARSAAAERRPHGAGRAGRRHMAARGAQRCLAEPADAPRPRPRSAGAPHRADGARFRPGARRARGDPHARRQARRRSHAVVALRAARCRGRRRGALARDGRARRSLSRACARARPAAARREDQGADAEAAARGAADVAQRHRDRALAARPVHDLRQARAAARARSMRSTRRPATPIAAPSSMASIGDFTRRFADALPADPVRRIDRDRATSISRRSTTIPRRAPSGGRASCASPTGSPAGTRERRGDVAAIARGDPRRDPDCGRRPDVHGCAASPTASNARVDGSYAILDYKTGQARTEKQVRTGLAPQLTLEAAILRQGGFPGIPEGGVGRRARLRAVEGRRAAGRPLPASTSRRAPPTARPTRRCAVSPGSRWPSRTSRRPTARSCIRCGRTHYGDYDHLARVKEWSVTGGEVDATADERGPIFVRPA